MITAPFNKCLVKIERRYQDGGQISVDPTWRPEEYATIEGEIVSVPINIENDHDRRVLTKLFKGDRIIFSYAVVYNFLEQPDGGVPVHRNLITIDDQEYWAVDAGEIYCRVKSEELEMVTDNVLLQPVGNVTRGTLIVSEEKKDHLGIVKSMPENISLSVRVGDTVCFEPRFVQKYNILGQELYILPSRRVLAKIN